jgi:hypothetical protein
MTLGFALFSLPALAHIGPEAMDRHFFEHLIIALAIGLPAGFGIYKLWSERKGKQD